MNEANRQRLGLRRFRAAIRGPPPLGSTAARWSLLMFWQCRRLGYTVHVVEVTMHSPGADRLAQRVNSNPRVWVQILPNLDVSAQLFSGSHSQYTTHTLV